MTDKQNYQYYFPGINGEPEIHETQVNSVIIIGANGSGKSKLGAWMEQQDGGNIHRVAAQRSLNFSEHVPLKSYTESEGELFYGNPDRSRWREDKGSRWDYGKSATTKLIQDFDAVLSALLAQYSNVTQQYFEASKEAETNGKPRPRTPSDPLSKLYNIWNSVFPQRQLEMKDSSFIAIYKNGDKTVEYPATQMSDGERSVLYLAAQVLCIPDKKTVIVDEPEIHLHQSLIGKLWQALEAERPDCLFIFITHDVQFAALHRNSDRIWVKNCDGENNWDLATIPSSELPEQLLLELLGNRKPVLFVEGNNCSYDIQLYSTLYPEYYVVPCGGCSQVITNTKAFSSTRELHECKVCGIIDRDFRSDIELENLEKKRIYSLKVAEVENLFLVEPLLRVVAHFFACKNVDKTVQTVKDYVINDRFQLEIESQICQATIATLKSQLSSIEIGGSDDDSVLNNFNQEITKLSPQNELDKHRKRFTAALEARKYDEVLKIFNDKNVSRSVGHFFGIVDKEYRSKIVALLTGNDNEKFVEALKPYIPELPNE